MKKLIAVLAFAPLAFVACKSNETSEKIDFTKSYENAALALTTAQKNYEAALGTSDTVQINAAKSALQTATANYIRSKNNYVAHGGSVNATYESSLSKSEQSLSHAAGIAKKADTGVGNIGKTLSAGNAKLENASKTVENTQKSINSTVTKTTQDISNEKAKAQAKISKTKNDFNNAKKSAGDEAKKLKNNLDNLFKN